MNHNPGTISHYNPCEAFGPYRALFPKGTHRSQKVFNLTVLQPQSPKKKEKGVNRPMHVFQLFAVYSHIGPSYLDIISKLALYQPPSPFKGLPIFKLSWSRLYSYLSIRVYIQNYLYIYLYIYICIPFKGALSISSLGSQNSRPADNTTPNPFLDVARAQRQGVVLRVGLDPEPRKGCLDIYMYIFCRYTCICMCICMCACMCIFMYVCTYVCMYVCRYVCMYICIYVKMYICIYVYLYICIYVYMYICICIYTYMHVYACMYLS